MNTRIICTVIFCIVAHDMGLAADDVPFGMFATTSESVFLESEEDLFFAAFDEQTGDALQKAMLEQKAVDDAQKEYEAHLRQALQQREEKRAEREQHSVKCNEQVDSVAYKFRNRHLRKQVSQQQISDTAGADQLSVDRTVVLKNTNPCRSVLSAQQLSQERASRKERVKAFALKQAKITRQAVATQHEMLALCHDIEMLRSKGGRYSNAHSSVMMKTEHSH